LILVVDSIFDFAVNSISVERGRGFVMWLPTSFVNSYKYLRLETFLHGRLLRGVEIPILLRTFSAMNFEMHFSSLCGDTSVEI